jgi:branched-chain amino acid transport system ATP-binding protein
VPPRLELADVHAAYGRVEVLHGISLTVPAGCVVAVLGPNGVGKTTTLRAISGTLPVSRGTIRLDGHRIENRRPSAIAAKGVVLVPEGRGIFPALTVRENLRIAHQACPGDSTPSWDAWCSEVDATFPRLLERLDQTAGLLSGGEQQMLALCRALVGDPKVVLFDELSMGLAPVLVDVLFDRVASLREQGRTIVLVEQYLSHALRLADVVYVLRKGEVAWVGEPGEVRDRPDALEYLAR